MAEERSQPQDGEQSQPKTLLELLESPNARKHITPYLPEGVSYELLVREMWSAAARDPKIKQCTPVSIIQATADAIRQDLIIGKTIFLVPRKFKIGGTRENPEYELRLTVLRHYVGDQELVIRSGAARSIDAQVVFKNEIDNGMFKVYLGSDPRVDHQRIAEGGNRGEMVGVYSIAQLSYYNRKVVYLTLEQVEAVRQKCSDSWKSGEMPEWYMKKTAIHRLCDQLPKTPKLRELLRAFEKEDAEVMKESEPLLLNAARPDFMSEGVRQAARAEEVPA